MKRKHTADLEFSGHGIYVLWANTQNGLEWILGNVSWEEWQGSPQDGIAIDGVGMAQDITDGAFHSGLGVKVNGRAYLGNGMVAK